MTADIDLDRRLSDWLTDGVPTHAPDQVFASAMERVDRATDNLTVSLRLGAVWLALTPRRRFLVMAAVLAALVMAAAAAGALLQKPPAVEPPRLLVVRPIGGSTETPGVAIVAVADDATERTLATFDADQLGGPWTGQTVTYSGDGRLSVPTYVGAADNQFAVVNLRDPAASPRFPDAVGSIATWRPDGRLAFDANDGTIAVYDVATGVTSRVAISDGETPPDTLQAVDVGLGPHRDRADGTRLGEPLDVERSHPDERVTDYAAARDGGRWVLLETRADGPSTVRLIHVAERRHRARCWSRSTSMHPRCRCTRRTAGSRRWRPMTAGSSLPRRMARPPDRNTSSTPGPAGSSRRSRG